MDSTFEIYFTKKDSVRPHAYQLLQRICPFKFKHYPFHILLHVVVCQYCTKILLGGEFKIHASPRSSDYVYMCIFVSTFIFLVSVHGYEVRRCFCYCCFFALFLHAFHIHLLPCKQYTIILSGVWVTLKTVVL